MTEHRTEPVETPSFTDKAIGRAQAAGLDIDFAQECPSLNGSPQPAGLFVRRMLKKIEGCIDRKGSSSPNAWTGLAVLEKITPDAAGTFYTVLGIKELRETYTGEIKGTLEEALVTGVCIPDLSDETGRTILRGYSERVNSHTSATYWLMYPDAPQSQAESMVSFVKKLEESSRQAQSIGEVSVADLG